MSTIYAPTTLRSSRDYGSRCQHCNEEPISRPRRLCWGCFYRPGVRELYPITSKFGRRGLGNPCGNRPLPPEPTDYLPGSLGKLLVMEERARLGFALHHPRDARRAIA